MTTMAKIFVVVNLILAGLGFGAAAALLGAQDNYKVALEETSKKAQETQQRLANELRDKESEVRQQRARASDATAAATQAESEKTTLQNELNKAKEINGQLLSTNQAYSSELKTLRELLGNLTSALETMREKTVEQTNLASEWQRKFQESESENARLTQTVNQQAEENTTLQAARADLEKTIKEQKFWLDAYRRKYGPIGEPRQLPDGTVLSVKRTGVGTFVALSVGRKDGLRIGDEYHLSRADKYVGRVEVIRLTADSAFCRADERWTGEAWPPQQNDKAWVE